MEHWQQWQGKVMGTDQDIKEALEILKRDPKNLLELQEVISKQRRMKLEKILKEADNFSTDLPY